MKDGARPLLHVSTVLRLPRRTCVGKWISGASEGTFALQPIYTASDAVMRAAKDGETARL